MKKIIEMILCFALVISLCACGNTYGNQVNVNSSKNNFEETNKLEEVVSQNLSDETNAEKNAFFVSNSIKEIIDVNEKPWGNNKFFYRYKNDEFPLYFTTNDDGTSGKMKKYDWKSDGKGIYLVDNKDKYFMYNGFLVGMINSALLEVGFQLFGSFEEGFYSKDDTIKFFADGNYEYWPSQKRCTQSGNYIMQDKHIMKLTYTVNGEKDIVYYFIDKENKAYIAYPQNPNAYN